jgi:ketosteroid isomerase-like protein
MEDSMPVPATVQAAMKQTNDIFCETVVKTRAFDALDRVYTPDARILPPGAPMMEGMSAIKGFWKQAVESLNALSCTLTSVAPEMAGDTVVEIGVAKLVLADGQTAEAKYVVHWKQDDGAWKWHTDIWNMNQ